MVFSRILLPLDGSVHAEKSILHAGRIARQFGSRVTLLRVLDGDAANGRTGSESIDWRLRRAEAERYLDGLGSDTRLDDVEVRKVLTEGKPADRIADHVRRNDINLVVMSSWGAGGESRFPHGGTAFKVLSSTPVSYLLVNESGARNDASTYGRILVPLDGTHKSEAAAQISVALAAGTDAEILLCHVFIEPSMPRRRPLTETEESIRQRLIECNQRVAANYLEELRDHFCNQHRVRTRLEVASDPVTCLGDVSRQESPDLMVLTAWSESERNGWCRKSILQTLLARVSLPTLVIQGAIEKYGDVTSAGGQ
ncbi:universal stress protein [Wenzhouxiangella sp. AB-CW3]|uniref:universal stress protein n=1 Tax=Wenzhouxiangella sp. AB-CW3 TaxID=2771012 RepID=UPI00168AB11F|nr:universal stress protein [Wenzhouxiangella sp. AB-CW3]QOC24034.1 universal stress protein [Wenzhouxiangella sp. AB-CW3]